MGGSSRKRGSSKKAAPPEAVAPEATSGLPMANVVRLMRQVLPQNFKIATPAKKLTHDCAVEFVGFVSGEAAERARAEHRRTMAPEDFTWSFQKLGFDSYVEPMTSYLHGYRAFENAGGSGGAVAAARPRPAPASPGEPAFTEEEMHFLHSVIPPLPNDDDGADGSLAQAPPSAPHGGRGYDGRM